MIASVMRGQELARVWIGHWLSRPFHHLFNLAPGLEIGLAKPELTRLHLTHSPLAGRRAVHLSDLHLDRYRPRHRALVRTVAELKPDWIFITGDLVNVRDGLPHLLQFLTDLRRAAPVFVTLGNHDHYSGIGVDEFADHFDRRKVTLLLNQVTFIPMDGGELAIVGLDDPSLHRADLRCIPSSRPGRFTLILAHAPNILDQLTPAHHADLTLCGHSHAGQWRIPYVPTFWLPPGCHGRTNGMYEKQSHRLYVNRGLGWSVIPMRLNCSPEIVLLEWAA
ncbi:metallophosphoesterase [Nitrospira defluvii]|uniref:Metallophosphoesterase n=1 Tax=Nitrospira defluvii TaxID=330214 RepID=A0ABM8QK64_9BACT|nr:metallophosphoesterase [Nitrospira defluvii]CAE6701667.1 Putative Metallophosphoesterase [Nitrospira defluvii]